MSASTKYGWHRNLRLSLVDDADIINDIENTPGASGSERLRNYVRLHSGSSFTVDGLTINVKKERS